jgi:hypothetical protein
MKNEPLRLGKNEKDLYSLYSLLQRDPKVVRNRWIV